MYFHGGMKMKNKLAIVGSFIFCMSVFVYADEVTMTTFGSVYGTNPLRAKKSTPVVNQVKEPVNNNQQQNLVSENVPASAKNGVKEKIAAFQNRTKAPVVKSYDPATAVRGEKSVSELAANYKGSKKIALPNNKLLSRSLVRNKNQESLPSQEIHQADGLVDVLDYADVYNSQLGELDAVRHETSPLNQDVNLEKVYEASWVEDRANPMRPQQAEAGLDYVDVYAHNEGLGSALEKNTNVNPVAKNEPILNISKQYQLNPDISLPSLLHHDIAASQKPTSVTDLVVYDPTQKYQKTLEVPTRQAIQQEIQNNKKPVVRKQLVVASQGQGGGEGLQKQSSMYFAPQVEGVVNAQAQNFGEVHNQAPTSARQVAQQSFVNKGFALNNAFNLAQQNKVAQQVEQPLVVEQGDMPEWAKNVKLPATSAKPLNYQLNNNQAKSMLDARGKMIQGYDQQAALKNLQTQQKAASVEKPVVRRGFFGW